MIKDCKQLLTEYEITKNPIFNRKKLIFEGVGGRDIYNITAPFLDQGDLIIAGRVEHRDSEDSEVYFFVEREGKWIPRQSSPILRLQDPFFTVIDHKFVVGGVQTFPHPIIENALSWRTVFYKGEHIDLLKEFFQGPDGMKDLRLVQLLDGRIGVFTRAQGEKGGRGKIGFTIVNKLDALTIEIIDNTPLLEGQFVEEEWGGCNEIHLLKDGSLGILGHIACFDSENNRHYYVMTFRMDPKTGETSEIKLLAARKDFLESEAKRNDLEDVVFSGGLVRHSNGTATLYAGISDADAQYITTIDPFKGL